MRKLGDPVLRTKARPVERFDGALRDEVRRMEALMHDALGIGLAAPQVGISHRLLVYRVEPDSPIVALVNPEIEWSSRDEEIAEEGCLSLPLVHVDVERPIGVLVTAKDERGEDLIIEATGLEARVIQHEIDHLDGVLILDRTTREQRKAAMRAMREAEQAAGVAVSGLGADRLPRHVGVRGRGAAPASPPPSTGRGSSSPAPTARRAAGRSCPRRRSRTPRARSGSSSSSRRTSTSPRPCARIAAAEPEVVAVCAFGALIKEPLLSDHELINVHPSLLPRWRGAAPVERAIMEGDAETGVSTMLTEAGFDTGPSTSRHASRSAPTTRTARSPRACRQVGADLLIRTLDERPSPTQQPDDGVMYAAKIGPDDRTLDPEATAAVNERKVRALTPHIGARVQLKDGSFLGVLRAEPREPEAAGPLRAEDGRLLLGGLELLEVQPPGGRPMDAAAYLRGHGV